MTQDIDVNAFAETLNDKLDRDLKNSAFNMDLVIAYKAPTAQDPTWYRQYKSGWIEQGGKTSVTNANSWTTVNLVKTMLNTDYFVSNSLFSDDAYWANQQPLYVGQKTTTSFLARCNQNTSFVMWEAKGFAANPEEGGDDESTYGNVYKTYFYTGCELDYNNAENLTSGVTTTMTRAGAVLFMAQQNASTHTYTGTINGLQVFCSIGYANAYYDTSPQLCSVSVGDEVFATEGINTYKFIPYKEPKQSTDITITTLVNAMYPVGSIYIGTTVNCPLASIIGTWTKIDGDLVLQSSSQAHQANTTIEAGLPNATGHTHYSVHRSYDGGDGVFSNGGGSSVTYGGSGSYSTFRDYFDLSRGGTDPIYGKSDTVQPPAYVVNVWRRTA